jgi:hypothetical protein
MWSVNLQSEDGHIDLTEMAKILGRSSDSARNVFDTYAFNPITLGICAKVLRVSAFEQPCGSRFGGAGFNRRAPGPRARAPGIGWQLARYRRLVPRTGNGGIRGGQRGPRHGR